MVNIFDTKSKKLHDINKDLIRIYLCGPTVYDRIHIGNARSLIVFDVLKKVFENNRISVIYARNITDIDDKIIDRAKLLGITCDELTLQTINQFHEDISKLGISSPDFEPKVSDNIPNIINFIQLLLDKNNAYIKNGHVLFDVSTYNPSQTLSGRNIHQESEYSRLEDTEFKNNKSDFVLWKPSTEDMPGWESPWGRGRPGWHIECSTMIYNTLGKIIDIHGGGTDLIFPHHENELAQSSCALNVIDFCHTWMHIGMVTVDGKKMSKSEGNFIYLHDLLKEFDGETIKLALLKTHYRSTYDFTKEKIKEAKDLLIYLYKAKEKADSFTESYKNMIIHIKDDLNTPALVSDLVEISSKIISDTYTEDNVAEFYAILNILGIGKYKNYLKNEIEEEILKLLAQRNAARKNRYFEKADKLRELIKEKGYLIEDRESGSELIKI